MRMRARIQARVGARVRAPEVHLVRIVLCSQSYVAGFVLSHSITSCLRMRGGVVEVEISSQLR